MEHWAVKAIRDLEQRRFYGHLTVKFRDGVVYQLEQSETIQPPVEKNSKEKVNV